MPGRTRRSPSGGIGRPRFLTPAPQFRLPVVEFKCSQQPPAPHQYTSSSTAVSHRTPHISTHISPPRPSLRGRPRSLSSGPPARLWALTALDAKLRQPLPPGLTYTALFPACRLRSSKALSLPDPLPARPHSPLGASSNRRSHLTSQPALLPGDSTMERHGWQGSMSPSSHRAPGADPGPEPRPRAFWSPVRRRSSQTRRVLSQRMHAGHRATSAQGPAQKQALTLGENGPNRNRWVSASSARRGSRSLDIPPCAS